MRLEPALIFKQQRSQAMQDEVLVSLPSVVRSKTPRAGQYSGSGGGSGLGLQNCLTDSLLLDRTGNVEAISDGFLTFLSFLPPAQWFAAGQCLKAMGGQSPDPPVQNLCSSCHQLCHRLATTQAGCVGPLYTNWRASVVSENLPANRPNSSFGPAVRHYTQRKGLSTVGAAP